MLRRIVSEEGEWADPGSAARRAVTRCVANDGAFARALQPFHGCKAFPSILSGAGNSARRRPAAGGARVPRAPLRLFRIGTTYGTLPSSARERAGATAGATSSVYRTTGSRRLALRLPKDAGMARKSGVVR
jgi:hypothetical protein